MLSLAPAAPKHSSARVWVLASPSALFVNMQSVVVVGRGTLNPHLRMKGADGDDLGQPVFFPVHIS